MKVKRLFAVNTYQNILFITNIIIYKIIYKKYVLYRIYIDLFIN